MENNVVIRVEHLSKVYKVFDKPIDRLKESLHPFRKRYSEDFHALCDVSFKIKKGETIGVIGKNGAGKSTLLKILTGVLTPTNGLLQTDGRIASLLELGAGFHLEMTGIENIYLNGTIMGYSKKEMDDKIASIIQFADIGEFINQPVKMYSSGMFARLAFSVAINVEPDILIVDEALAVGDFMFQFKCLQKFKELQEKKVTIFFVSHSMQQIISVCNRALFFHQGRLRDDSYDVERVVFDYEKLIRDAEGKKEKLNRGSKPLELVDFDVSPNQEVNEYRFGTHRAIIREVTLYHDESSQDEPILKAGKFVHCRLLILSQEDINLAVCGISIKNVKGEILWGENTLKMKEGFSLKKGKNVLIFRFRLNIVSGGYLLAAGLADISKKERTELDQRWPVKRISIISSDNVAEGYVYAPATLMVE